MTKIIYILFLLFLCIGVQSVFGAEQGEVEYGIATDYLNDENIGNHPAVIFASGFDNADWAADFNYSGTIPQGYSQSNDSVKSYTSSGYLEIQQTEGTHQPMEFHPAMPDTEVVYVRWYRKYEEGYDWTQHKMSGVYARRPGLPGGTAGIPPDGTDKYSCKLYVSRDGSPRFYSYHPDQAGPYGDCFQQNIGPIVKLVTERWYCFEMMIKANTPGIEISNNEYTEGAHDGELKMWIDGVLKGHITGLRFRDAPDLFINEFTHSAYVGGNWVSKRDQKLWEDNYVVATEYIGPVHDNKPPEVIAINQMPYSVSLGVVFNKQIEAESATSIENYSIAPIDSVDQDEVDIFSVELGRDLKSVILTTSSPLVEGQSYTISVINIADREPIPKIIDSRQYVNFQVPLFELLVDFGPTEEGNIFGVTDWNTVFKDVYSENVDSGPGGVTIDAGSNGNYNFQGITGPEKIFKDGDKIVVRWFNNSDEEVKFTPRISFDDANRPIESSVSVGQWHLMSSWYNSDLEEVFIAPHGTEESVFQFNAHQAGSYSLVNVNVNYSNQQVIVCDKIMLLTYVQEPDTIPPTIPTDFAAEAVSDKEINLSWNSADDNLLLAGYILYRNNEEIARPDAASESGIWSYVDDNLSAATTYTYTVVAIDKAGNVSAESDQVTETTLMPVEAKKNVTFFSVVSLWLFGI